MAEAASAAGTPKVSRLDRRKARTRQALIDAAVRLIAEGRGDRASIQEITEEADIGFGSFYNHFDSKEQLFAAASEEVLERWGQMIDRGHRRHRRPGRAVRGGHPDLRAARLDPPRHRRVPHRRRPGRRWTSPAAWRRAPCATSRPGRPRAGSPRPDPEIALSAVAGGLLGLLRMCQRHPERVDETTVDQLAEAELRLLGVPADEAARLTALPLPPADTW